MMRRSPTMPPGDDDAPKLSHVSAEASETNTEEKNTRDSTINLILMLPPPRGVIVFQFTQKKSYQKRIPKLIFVPFWCLRDFVVPSYSATSQMPRWESRFWLFPLSEYQGRRFRIWKAARRYEKTSDPPSTDNADGGHAEPPELPSNPMAAYHLASPCRPLLHAPTLISCARAR